MGPSDLFCLLCVDLEKPRSQRLLLLYRLPDPDTTLETAAATRICHPLLCYE